MADDVRPRVSGSIPWCDDTCPSHDGKRCRILGEKPGAICEPMVRRIVAANTLMRPVVTAAEAWRFGGGGGKELGDAVEHYRAECAKERP